MSNRVRHIALGVAAVFTVSALSGLAAWRWERRQLIAEAEAVSVQVVDQVLDQYAFFLEFKPSPLIFLEDNEAGGCDPRSLAVMRHVIFDAQLLRDIAIIEDDAAQCTGLFGVFDNPIELNPPAAVFENGNAIRFQTWLWDDDRPIFSVRFDRYELLLWLDRFEIPTPPWMTTSVVIFGEDDDLPSFVIGPVDEVRRGELDRTSVLQGDNFLIGTCTANGGLCAAARGDVAALLETERFRLIGSAGTAAAITALGFGLVIVAGVAFGRRDDRIRRIRRCLSRHGYEFYFQPIIDLTTGRPVGAEALVRSRSDYHDISVGDLVDVAERDGYSGALAVNAIEQSMRDLAEIFDSNPSFFVSVNFAPVDLCDGKLRELITNYVEETKIPRNRLHLEVTERANMDDATLKSAIDAWRAAGFAVAIDDFGTGYQNLQRLSEVHADTIKVDRMFTAAIGKGSLQEIMLDRILDMFGQLDKVVIVEGVETEAQETFLREHGVSYAQGWRYTRALPSDEFVKWTRDHVVDETA